MIPRTFPAVLSRHSQHPLGCDYELPGVVTYEWHPADASGDATAEIVAVVDEGGRDVHLTPREEVRLMALAESYETNPVQVTRYALEVWSGIGWSHVRNVDGYAAAFDAVRRYAAKGWTARVTSGGVVVDEARGVAVKA